MIRKILFAALAVTLPVAAPAAHAADTVSGQCTYAGYSQLSGHFTYVWGGAVVTTSTDTRGQAVTTYLTCTLVSPTQGLPGEEPARSESSSNYCAASACATTSSSANWPARPVQICISGYAVFFSGTQQITPVCRNSSL